MKDIKLIVTDMDGTFLNSKHEVSPEFPEIYEELKRRNILFVPASGRQMLGITKYFGDIENEMAFIAENGGYMIYKNEELFADKLQEKYVEEIICTIREISGATVVISGKKCAYYESENQEFIDYISQFYTGNQQVNDLTEALNDSIFKIAIYHPEGSEEHLYPVLKQFQKYDLEVVVSGKNWLDIMNKNINKGNALAKLQTTLNISPQQTMVFGDYMNDIEMLQKAEYSFAMENAHPTVKEAAKFEACSNNNFGVLKTIKNYLTIN
ncbi:5-amino-6-(5-phospho-D-ribitylamino)uracil phosphatase YbjI [Chryseobacterium aquaeductus]|uniref:5-amino-6-(5-phospho-D-ribitylamino)uracil phosphatase YbjI n=1 Tax=Chryseobacterium aquaeductus TaxID=2675056 RepID=A0A9N8QTH2_9FLAO|nr:Cof-type HAD-IIB family hydrolase [Chryseobacterium aquaeductus]CAA7332397.1 5-amino-6-(5-phospho-D-ribitylamino)uracil phosphatase YbjI [Chryseobacterium potabilaquae]CAD7816194.1 5-amino-6-(5-phospho-D-ribitylamino)uracil phosphatase YbjI [Chryseobacterium aquaeductus]